MALEVTLATIIVSLAALAALGGLLILGSFFRDKIKDLFDDRQYLIFFFLVTGYFLYALGEVSFYLMKFLTNHSPQSGISDVYWVGGSALILISFFSLTDSLYKNNSKNQLTQLLIGIILIALVTYILVGINQGNFFQYYYPVVSAIIVSLSLSVFFHYREMKKFNQPLLIFSLASIGILVGDLFFSYVTIKNLSSGAVYLAGDIFYCLGYGLSFLAFIILYWKMHQESKE